MKKVKRISVNLPYELLAKVDAFVGKNYKRSKIIEDALRDYLAKENRRELSKRDLEIINANAEEMNKQTLETQELLADLTKDFLKNENSSKRNEQF
jgi:metal-responsive CopG/Arc/MetJ family transcriptional regulator